MIRRLQFDEAALAREVAELHCRHIEGGVLGILPGIIGLVQATETVKLILGAGQPLVGRLMLYDALGMKFRELKLRKNPECPVCGDHRTITKLIDYHQFCGVPQQAAVETPVNTSGEIQPVDVKAKQDRGDKFVLVDVQIGRAHV